MSETLGVNVEYKNLDCLSLAILAMGGKVLGMGTHRLYAGKEKGFGFQLKGWSYPCVLRADGVLRYDDYHGSWGNVADLKGLSGEYALTVAEEVAHSNGLQCARVSDAIKVYHPGGREVWIFGDGRVEAVCFHGVGCHEATSLFTDALGSVTSISHKREFNDSVVKAGVSNGNS